MRGDKDGASPMVYRSDSERVIGWALAPYRGHKHYRLHADNGN